MGNDENQRLQRNVDAEIEDLDPTLEDCANVVGGVDIQDLHVTKVMDKPSNPIFQGPPPPPPPPPNPR